MSTILKKLATQAEAASDGSGGGFSVTIEGSDGHWLVPKINGPSFSAVWTTDQPTDDGHWTMYETPLEIPPNPTDSPLAKTYAGQLEPNRDIGSNLGWLCPTAASWEVFDTRYPLGGIVNKAPYNHVWQFIITTRTQVIGDSWFEASVFHFNSGWVLQGSDYVASAGLADTAVIMPPDSGVPMPTQFTFTRMSA